MTGATGTHDNRQARGTRPGADHAARRRVAPSPGCSEAASRCCWSRWRFDTTVVPIDPEGDAAAGGFSPAAFGAAEFPRIRAAVETRAADAVELAAAIAEDKAAAAERYGTPAGIGAVMPVRFTGIVGEGRSGVYDVAVEGPARGAPECACRPAPRSTAPIFATRPETSCSAGSPTRSSTRDAGSAINAELKRSVLEGLDTSALTGREGIGHPASSSSSTRRAGW